MVSYATQTAQQDVLRELLGEPRRIYKRQDVQVVLVGQFAAVLELFRRFYTAQELLSLKELGIEIEKEIPLLLKADFLLSMYYLTQDNQRGIGNEIK